MVHTTLQQFLPAIQTLHTEEPFTKDVLLTKRFLMEKDGDLKMYYAPHNEYINKEAKIIIVGITPGWRQMKTAFEHFVNCLEAHKPIDSCLYKAKKAAGFAGSMRTNLLAMLDQCHIPEILNIPSSLSLFGENNQLLHTTSMIKYPVFFKDKNYTGHQPSIHRSALLREYIYSEFPKEINQITPPALIIPLGKTVEQIIFRLIEEQKLPNHDYLFGFPHPSGANGHRIRQFEQQKYQLREKVSIWADSLMKASKL